MEQYLHHNYKYTCLISEACKRLKLSSISCYTACYLYHNFNEKTAGQAFLWMKVSSEYKSVFAVTSIYLASKLAEEPTKIRDIVNVSSRILHPDDDPLNIGERYWSLRDSVLNCELYLLRMIQFDAALDYPQNYLLSYLNSLKPWVLPPQWEKANVSQMAWNLLQDSFHLPVKEASEILALGVLKLAIDASELEISNEGTSIVWWKALCENANEDKLHSIGCDVMQVLNCEEKRNLKPGK